MKQSIFTVKQLKYLGWIGPILIIIGFTARLVADTWGNIPLALVLGGVLVLMLWLVSESNALPGFLGRRSTQASTNVLISTVAMVVILGLVNFLAVRSLKQIDLTENQLFTLAPQTQQLLTELEQPVDLFFFRSGEGGLSPSDQELLDQYQRQSDRFNYQLVDPQAEPALAQKFGVQTAFGEVYLESGNRRHLVQTVNPGQTLTERELTNGIVTLLSDYQPRVYFVQGHGEHPLDPGQGGITDAVNLLEGENYQVETLDLAAVGNVPEDADVVIIAGAEQAFFEAEVDALHAYLQKRSGLLVLLEPQTEPELDDLFEDWGIDPIDRLIIDPAGQNAGLDVTTTIVQSYGDHPITAGFGNRISFFPATQPINLEVQDEIESAPLLITSQITKAFAIPEDGEEIAPEILEETAMEGPLVFGVAMNQPVVGDEEVAEIETGEETGEEENQSEEAELEDEVEEVDSSIDTDTVDTDTVDTDEAKLDEDSGPEDGAIADEARLVVIGNSSFVLNNLVTQQLNGDVFLNTVGWLSQDNRAIAIRPKEVTNRRIVLDAQKLVTIALTALAILPLIGFGGAVFLWLKRR